MDAPQYQQAPLDPSFLLLQQQSQQQDVDAITERTRGDTASILARYGAMSAMAGTNGTQSLQTVPNATLTRAVGA